MKRISKKVREEAALLCAVIASSEAPGDTPCNCFGCASAWMQTSAEAAHLADLARAQVPESYCYLLSGEFSSAGYALQFAEAEALLRTGWSPT